MAEQKHFVLIGLGSFGRAMAIKLKQNGCRVSGIDAVSEHVEDLKDILYEAVIGDATLKESLEPLLLNRATGVFVSMGEDIARSILATLHARELGAKQILVKGVTPEHGKVLKALGVARVVFPEVEIAQQVADQLTWPNIIDRLPIDSEHSFVEIAVPSALVGKTLVEGDLRRKFGVFVVGVKDVFSGKLHMFPEPDFKLNDDQILLIVGKEEGVSKFRKNL